MKRTDFNAYLIFLLRIISKCCDEQEMTFCYQMIQDFDKHFTGIVTIKERADALADLTEAFQLKIAENTIDISPDEFQMPM